MADDELRGFKERVDAELRCARPDRYEPGGDWLDLVAESVKDQVPILTAQQILARQIVGEREGQATKRVNKFLRGIAGVDGQYALPVDWYFYADEPVAIEVPVINEQTGEQTGTHRVRVALRAMRPGDWQDFATAGREMAQHRFDAEMRMYDGADWVRQEQGARTFADWAELVQPKPDQAAS